MSEMISIPVEEYLALLVAAEELAELSVCDCLKKATESGQQESVPAKLSQCILAHESRLRVWREFRGLTIQALADASGVNLSQITNIEAGTVPSSMETLLKLAIALNVTVGDLV